MCTSVCGISSEVSFNLLKLPLHQETSISLNIYTTLVVFAARNRHFESLFCVRCVLCTSCCVGVTLTNTKANLGFVLYDQLNKAYLYKKAAFPTYQFKPVFAKNAPINKTYDTNFKSNRIYYEPTSLGS